MIDSTIAHIEAHLRTLACPFMDGWHNVRVFAILPTGQATNDVVTPPSWRSLEGHYRFLVVTTPAFANYSNYIMTEHVDARLA